MVKKSYEVPQEVEYPLVVITEILNSENTRYTTNEGEQVTNLTYQIDCQCKQTKIADGTILNAPDSSKLLGIKISKLLGGQRYKMRRVGDNAQSTLRADRTIMRNINRYECCLYLKQDTIYRR